MQKILHFYKLKKKSLTFLIFIYFDAEFKSIIEFLLPKLKIVYPKRIGYNITNNPSQEAAHQISAKLISVVFFLNNRFQLVIS